MEPLIFKGTEIYPNIVLEPQKNIFEITGRSIPSDGKTFYEPVIEWLDNYSLNPNQITKFTFNLEFFNISSSKMLLFILYKLNDIKTSGKEVVIDWYYGDEDDDMFEVGEDYAYMVDVPFNFIMDTDRKRQSA